MRYLIPVLAVLLATSAHAQLYKGESVQVGVGYYDLFDSSEAASFNVEYQHDDLYHGFRPVAGLMVTSDAAKYGYAGFRWDLPLGIQPVVIAPTFNVGAYSNGDGKDLGHGLEFRSGIEAAFETEAGNRIGLHLSHISNASIGDSNPGTEILQLTYSTPVDVF